MAIDIRAKIQKCRELIVYCIIGCSGAAFDFAIYSVLTGWLDMHYQPANLLSVSFGIINNFFLNYFFNFKPNDRMFIRLVGFYVVGMLGWALSATTLWLFIEKLRINVISAKFGTIILVAVVQFGLNKFITFRKTNSTQETNNV